MGLFRALLLVILGALAFGMMLFVFGAGETLADIPPTNLLLIFVPAPILGLAGGMTRTPRTKKRKSMARGATEGGILSGLAAVLGGLVIAIIGLASTQQTLGGLGPIDPGEALARAALLPGVIYFVIGVLMGLLGALIVRGGRRRKK